MSRENLISSYNYMGDSLYSPPNNTESEVHSVVAVFVASFDTKKGNIMEWQLPNEISLNGIEFRALVSGSHSLESDYVYFRHGKLYGLAVSVSRHTENQNERHFRLRSVGVLCSSALLLHQYRDFLEKQSRSQINNPGNYDSLIVFYDDWNNCTSQGQRMSLVEKYSKPEVPLQQQNKCFDYFVYYFGPDIMILWKAMLLNLRILFYSPPPIGPVCHRVYFTHLLQAWDQHLPGLEWRSTMQKSDDLYYVSVADIDQLKNKTSFVACTTESIFFHKSHLYDVYVDVTKITIANQDYQTLLKINIEDQMRFERLTNARNGMNINDDDVDDEIDSEMIFINFFRQANNQLWHFLSDIGSPHADDHLIRDEHFRLLSLHPRDDRHFVGLLLQRFHIDAIIATESCC